VGMTLAQSRITAQGQVSVPVKVRQRLGVGPGAVIEWDEEEGKIFVRKMGRFNSRDLHEALFEDGPPKPRSLAELKQGIREQTSKKYARD